MKKAHIISIGNELLIGDTVNTNAAWIGNFLTDLGFDVEQVTTIPDDYTLIYNGIKKSFKHADFTVVTGGLGPTHDDITKKVVNDLFESTLVENSEVFAHIKKIFEQRDFEFSPSNAAQAMVPDKCTVLYNKQGTAPGMWFGENERYLAVLPGVPFEMKFLMREEVQPKIDKLFAGHDVWMTEYFRTAGVPESTLSDLIGDLDEFTDNGIGIAYLPNTGGVTIRLSTSAPDKEKAQKKLYRISELVNQKASDYIFGKGKDLELAKVVGDLLNKKNMNIGVSESCTGGLLSNSISDIPGCSEYFIGSVVAYSNDLKIKMLNVDPSTIEIHGAVSKEIALEMAEGVAKQTGSDVGVSTTGIAGPGGGTKEKPVGTVWMGFWINGNHFALKTVFTNDRLINKQRTVMVVLETLRRQLLGIESLPYQLKPHRIQ